MGCPRACPPTICALAALVLLAGCERSDTVEPRGRTIELRLTEYRIEPQRIRADAGRLRIRTSNGGILAHSVAIERDDEPIERTRLIKAGERAAETVSLSPGEYRLLCPISNHGTLGMRGTLEVQ